MRVSGRELGARGEQVAAEFLINAGMRLLARNARTSAGELDLVMDEGGAVVVVEVKSRVASARVGPAEAITAAKARRLISLGERFLNEAQRPDVPWRIDVVTVLFDDSGQVQEVEHIRNAVTGEG